MPSNAECEVQQILRDLEPQSLHLPSNNRVWSPTDPHKPWAPNPTPSAIDLILVHQFHKIFAFPQQSLKSNRSSETLSINSTQIQHSSKILMPKTTMHQFLRIPASHTRLWNSASPRDVELQSLRPQWWIRLQWIRAQHFLRICTHTQTTPINNNLCPPMLFKLRPCIKKFPGECT